MARDLSLLIHRDSPHKAKAVSSPVAYASTGILDRQVARRLGKPAAPRRPWVEEQDLRDALMTFALVFTGAMVFLF